MNAVMIPNSISILIGLYIFNRNSPSDTGFYLVQLKVLQVQDTYTPIFEVIAKPSEETKLIGIIKKDFSEADLLHVEFFFSDMMPI